MISIYEKNLQALQKNRPELHKKLKKIDTNERFEVFVAGENINILDTKKNIVFYNNPKEEIKQRLDEYKKYREYPFLYLFGIADGKIVQDLLLNKNLEQLVIIEPEIELIYIALNLQDLSENLKNNRLLILEIEEVTYNLLINLIHVSNAKYYIKIFKFLNCCEYYTEAYYSEYKKILKLWVKALGYVAQASGNDINDTFVGLKQHLENTELMLSKARYQDVLVEKQIEVAVVVSTGPSLNKQLPLLKEYQDKICILSVDASFPILLENGIRPDFVFSMERDTPTAQFFKQVKKMDQQGTIFVCASLQHKEVFKHILSEDMFLVMRPFGYNSFFELDQYGYLCKGMSSANMAHEFATAFGFKNITFIGQDLSFGENFETHAEGHMVEDDLELKRIVQDKDFMEVEAYGGKGTAYTEIYWNIFKNFIEHHIQETKSFATTYNSTEGGVRIDGAIEKLFAEFLEEFAIEKKNKIHIKIPSQDEILKLQKKTKQKLEGAVTLLEELQNEINTNFLKIAEECKVYENKSEEEAVKLMDAGKTMYLLELISKIRDEVQNSSIYTKFLSSIAQPLLYNMELELAEIKTRYVDNPYDNQLKAIQWILGHRFWLFSLSGIIENTVHSIKECSLYKHKAV